MARERYIALDPLSSVALVLHDPSGSPQRIVQRPTVRHPRETQRGFTQTVGCGSAAPWEAEGPTTIVSLRITLETFDPAVLDPFLAALRAALLGDQSVPRQATATTFRVYLRQDQAAGRFYGYELCTGVLDYDEGVQDADGRFRYDDDIRWPEARLEITAPHGDERSFS